MTCLSPIRLLIPVSIALVTIPWVFREYLLNYYSFTVFYFFGSYFFFINFPILSEILHTKPVYIEDLILTSNQDAIPFDNHSFKKKYTVLMNVILAILFSIFADYVILQGVHEKSIIEVMGILGGNLSLYNKVQNTLGKSLLTLCNCFKTEEQNRRTSLDITNAASVTRTPSVHEDSHN
jgi:hypothetical protein